MNSCQTYKEQLDKLYLERKKSCAKWVRKDAELYKWVCDHSQIDSDNLSEIIYSIMNPSESQTCASGNRRKFRNITVGWLCCNDRVCTDCRERTEKKKQNTCIEKYGVSNPMQVSEIKNKMTASAIKNDSYTTAQEKRKTFYLDNYGVDHNWKTAQGQEKRKRTIEKKYGVDNPSKSPELQNKKIETCLENYGVQFPMQSDEIQTKIKQTLLREYGVDNISKLPEIRDKACDTNFERYGVRYASQSRVFQEKAKQTLIDKYGVEHPAHSLEIINKSKSQRLKDYYNNIPYRVDNRVTPLFAQHEYIGVEKTYEWMCNTCNTKFLDNLDNGNIPSCPTCFPYVKSRGEQELYEFVQSLGIFAVRNSRSIIPPQEIDVFVPDSRIAFEFNGLYWHSEISGNKDRFYHLNKKTACAKLGIHLVQILDTEWTNKRKLVESRIKQLLGLNRKIPARKCQIKTISSAETKEFLDKNHIQGYCTSSINYGLFFQDQLISVMTFGKSRYNKSAQYELLRFCNKITISVTGGASKLLAHFESEFKNPRIISYCDLRWNTGKVYEIMGFQQINPLISIGLPLIQTWKFRVI
jgi:hypothetical protein